MFSQCLTKGIDTKRIKMYLIEGIKVKNKINEKHGIKENMSSLFLISSSLFSSNNNKTLYIKIVVFMEKYSLISITLF
jgi:hypothetical protein